MQGMSEEELKLLKAEIKAEVLKDITGKDYKTANSKMGVFDQVRDRYKKPLYDTYGTVTYWKVWEHIRGLACLMSGVRYVRDLSPSKEMLAADIAEKLCQMAIQQKDIKSIANVAKKEG